MSKRGRLSHAFTCRVRDTCLCLHVQRAARALARRFDEALRPLALTQGQFSLLMSLNRPQPPSIGEVSALLAMDRTTVTANVKPLERRGLVKVSRGPRRQAQPPAPADAFRAGPPRRRRPDMAARACAATERRLRSSSPDILRASLHDLS